MANKIKVPNHIKKRFERKEHKRKTNTTPKRKYYLIICEGEKTEPQYFESLKKDLPRGIINTYQIYIEGTGKNTLSLLEEAKKRKKDFEENGTVKIDKVWLVFDKDSFPAQNFNSTIQQCKASKEIEEIWSNEAFELWYLLHFNFCDAQLDRKDYGNLIEDNLKKIYDENFKYQKNDPRMYDILKSCGDYKNAISNAKKLDQIFNDRTDYTNHNPSTKVYKVVEELFNLLAK